MFGVFLWGVVVLFGSEGAEIQGSTSAANFRYDDGEEDAVGGRCVATSSYNGSQKST